jgi:hypothetical protein
MKVESENIPETRMSVANGSADACGLFLKILNTNKAIFYICDSLNIKELYVKCIQEKYICVCISGMDETPSIIEKRVSALNPEDLSNLVILVCGHQSVIADSLQSEIINRIENNEPGKIVVSCESMVQITHSLHSRLIRTNNPAIVMKYLDYKQKTVK